MWTGERKGWRHSSIHLRDGPYKKEGKGLITEGEVKVSTPVYVEELLE